MNENQMMLRDAGHREQAFAQAKLATGVLPNVKFEDLLSHAVYNAREDTVTVTVRGVTYCWPVRPLRTYSARFSGRTRGAIGITHDCMTTVVAEDEEQARLALYDRFDHIGGLVLREVDPR